MGGMFGGGKAPSPPPKPDPQAIPETQTASTDEMASRERHKKGFASNISPGNLAPTKGKSKLGGGYLLGGGAKV